MPESPSNRDARQTTGNPERLAPAPCHFVSAHQP